MFNDLSLVVGTANECPNEFAAAGESPAFAKASAWQAAN
jgi:hypothetical protein